ncbi:hypothetical protein [Pseudalkalibacillus salsuginis]|uniref:hypothetical protein n=1 Tax=Pseudalkalibacillus salsuginis TaxID=2910972 RepID=UPI001F4529A7|nr:hypothetical protein [Pseudalkalibacillus salsuginis]MCF6409886.1 hypothetical protein [Pseudalkalibacillus salsuginis]
MRKDFDECNSCICKLFRKLDSGTTIQFAIDDTDEFFENEDFTFICLDEKKCCITLNRPQEDSIVFVDCTRIAGVKIIEN